MFRRLVRESPLRLRGNGVVRIWQCVSTMARLSHVVRLAWAHSSVGRATDF